MLFYITEGKSETGKYMISRLIVLIILIGINAFFASTEIAFISLNDAKIEKQAKEGNKKAKQIRKMLKEPSKFLATIQIGITLAGFLSSAFAADAFASELAPKLNELIDLGISTWNTISIIIITIILSYFSLVFGELVPKRIAMRNPEKIAFGTIGVIRFIHFITSPVVNFLNFSTNLICKLFGIGPQDESTVTEEEIRMMVDVGEEKGSIEEEEKELMDYTQSLGMVFLSTPFSRAAAVRLEKFGVAAYKIGSGELNNYPLIEHIAEYGKPMIVSTGMNDIRSIAKAVNILEKYGVEYALMHTTNLYPTDPALVRLGAMQELMREFPDVPVGLSDHTLNNNACIAAMALGAKLVERHFTDYMERTGPDIVCSMDEQELGKLLQAANEVPQMLGGTKCAAAEEQVTIDFAFATVVAIRDIKKGESFTKENIWVKRPGTGEIPAEDYPNVLGKKATCDIASDTQIKKSMVESL